VDRRTVIVAGVTAVIASTGTYIAARLQPPPTKPPDIAEYLVVWGGAAALILRRRRPLLAVAASISAACLSLAFGYPYGPTFLAPAVAMYSAATLLVWQSSLWACMTCCIALAWTLVLRGATTLPAHALAPMVTAAFGWVTVPCVLGLVRRIRSESRLQSDTDETARQAAAQRLRIAEMINSTVGQRLTSINIQSAAALHLAETDPVAALRFLETIKADSTAVLRELRAALQNLAGPYDPDNADRVQLPGFEQIHALVPILDQCALTVTVSETGERSAVSGAVELAAYRIVQQSLAGALRNSSSSTATVEMEHTPHGVVLTISDDRDEVAAAAAGAAAELSASTERVAALGGTLRASPLPGGGFQVRVRMPAAAGLDHPAQGPDYAQERTPRYRVDTTTSGH
jgi:signal transduction histidine kinase